jgi:hypothetical protein
VQSVYQHVVGTRWKALDGTRHRQQGGLQNIDAVDVSGVSPAQTPCICSLADDFRKPLPGQRGQLFRITQAIDGSTWVEHYGGGHHRTRQGPPPGFVNARDQFVLNHTVHISARY